MTIGNGSREQGTKEVDHFKLLGNVLTRDLTYKDKMKFSTAKEECNRKTSFLTFNLHSKLRKILVRCCIWSVAFNVSETWILRKLERKYLKIS